ncbi:MAG: hypothetical protein JST47_06710 [Bacteroidetes bacterium]|nr:hypothetical protein [Bacteroidota bacterium]MBS1974274.1 hypothetical protein [Bacteroidota bacterium]
MEFEEIKEIILSLEDMTSKRMRTYIHYKSMQNFVEHFHEIKNERAQRKIIDLISEYIEEIKAGNYDFDVHESANLAKRYVFSIAQYYKEDSSFMEMIKLQHVFLYGLLIDSLLYLGGVLSKFWYVPIATSGFLFYYLFVVIIKERKGRVYGMFY